MVPQTDKDAANSVIQTARFRKILSPEPVPEEAHGIVERGAQTLNAQEFLDRLRVEKLRADRSRSPLSLATFKIGPSTASGRNETRKFWDHVVKSTRETDLTGILDARTIALLMPDTGEKEAKNCLARILQGNGKIRCSAVSATYPDHLLHTLLHRETDPTAPLFLDLVNEDRQAFRRAVKRAMDIVGSLMALFLLLPVMILAAGLIRLTSPGPVIFKQIRIGWKGRKFFLYKFRSMVSQADDRIHREYVADLIQGRLEKVNRGEAGRPLYKLKDDDRVTPIGRILRRLSLDELPQFFNVLKGDMSLVGPRPPLPYEVEKYEPWHFRRILNVKPGITGLWQVNGRNRTTFDEMVRLDLRYMRNWSLWLDVKILGKTFKEILRPQGGV